jgi:hypothetical protein
MKLTARIATDLLETDALTPNTDGTPTHYTVAAENIEYLVQTVLAIAESSTDDV